MCQDGGLYHLYGFMLLITELHLICFHNFGSSYRTNLSPGLSFIIADFEMNPPTVLIFRTAGQNHKWLRTVYWTEPNTPAGIPY